MTQIIDFAAGKPVHTDTATIPKIVSASSTDVNMLEMLLSGRQMVLDVTNCLEALCARLLTIPADEVLVTLIANQAAESCTKTHFSVTTLEADFRRTSLESPRKFPTAERHR